MEKTDNELIAEFMGGQILNDGRIKEFVIDEIFYREREIKYDTSWDWLMPVVEKIESQDRTLVNIYGDGTNIWVDDQEGNELFGTTKHGNKDDKIGHVYRAVIEYIEWYNASQEVR